jgi:hypothetical protein
MNFEMNVLETDLNCRRQLIKEDGRHPACLLPCYFSIINTSNTAEQLIFLGNCFSIFYVQKNKNIHREK